MSYTLVNPATEESMETIPHASIEEVDAAIAKASIAQKKWARLNPADRARSCMILRR